MKVGMGMCDGERRENEMFYNLIMHRVSIMFPNSLENTIHAL